MIDPQEVVSGPSDLARINSLLGELEGQPCWRLEFIYGDELVVAFGAQVKRAGGPLKGKLFGEWELVTRASPWRVFRPDGSEVINAEAEREEAEPHFGEVTGRRVKTAAASLPDLDLRIELEDGTRLDVPCGEKDETDSSETEGSGGAEDTEDTEDTEDLELACWEVYLPGDRLLSVWPGGRWALTRLD
jgi:hypothetical protein